MGASREDARDKAFDEGLFALILLDAEGAGDADRAAKLCAVDVRRLLVRLGSMSGHLIATLLPEAEQAGTVAFAKNMLDLGIEAARTGTLVPVFLHGEREH